MLPVQLEHANPVLLGQSRPILILLYQLIFLLFELLQISEQQPGGCFPYYRNAHQCAMITWGTANNKQATAADFECTKAPPVSFCYLLFELLLLIYLLL